MKKHLSTQTRKRMLSSIGLILFSVSFVLAQVLVKGTVKDNLGEGVPGASVQVKGTSQGTITDLDGKFAFNVPNKNSILVISFIGYVTVEMKVDTQKPMVITLKEDTKTLDEVVVVGYQEIRKRDLTGSVAKASMAELLSTPTASFGETLGGRIAGVNVSSGEGMPGGQMNIVIRGNNSLTQDNSPLYVIDGFPVEDPSIAAAINQNDIESLDFLKDASATAIYGARGANGVVMITTKKGTIGQPKIKYDGSFGIQHITKTIPMMDAYEFVKLQAERSPKDMETTYFMNYDGKKWGLEDYRNIPQYNWQDEIFQTAFITNNNISITGASPKHSFYLGVGYSYEQGNIEHEKFSKVTINASNDYKITDYLKVGFQFNGARMLPADSKQVLNALRATPIAPVYNDEYGLYSALPEFQKAQINNPMVDVSLRANTTKAENYRASGNIYGEVDFLKHFNFKAMFSMDYASNNGRTYQPIVKVYDPTVSGNIATLGTGKTEVSQFKENETKVQSDYVLTYTNSFDNGNHNLTATAGFTTYYNSLSRLDGARKQGVGLVIPNDPDKWFVSIGDAATATNGSTQWERSTLSMLARVIYNYKGKYLFNGSFRRDGSSAFSYTGNEWQNFFSLGGGWLMSEEEFMKDIKWLDMLKIKASYGTLGNQNLDKAYPAEPLLSNAYSAVFGKPSIIYPGYQLAYLPNPNLRWEKVEAWEAGFETNLLRNRLHFEGVYYKKNTKDLLAEVPGISGTIPGIGNLGQIQNKGVEMAVTWRDQIGEWGYSVSANLTTIKNEVKSLVQEGYSIIAGDKQQSYTMAGYPIGYFYGYKVEGVYQSQADIDASPKNTLATVTPGDLKFADVDGNGEITPEDRTMIGNPTPKVTYGFSLGVNYKNWSLGIDMMGQGGNKIFRTWDNYNFAQFNYLEQRLDRWHGEGTSNTQPLLNSKHSINYLNSDYYIESGNFFRIRNVQLAYAFDKSLLAKIRLQALKVYVNIQNLKTWKHNTGYTPELGGTATAFGVDNGSYPVPAVYTFGINLTF